MPPRSTWKGFLNLSLVSFPVKAYTSSNSSADIRLNQLHEECNSRIRYEKSCPVHGKVSNDEIVSGFEYSKDQYVVVDPGELDKLRTERDKSITIDAVVNAGAIDPIYHTGKTYYLVPDGPVGQKPYSLILQIMNDRKLHAVCQTVLSGKEYVVLLRPVDRLMAMTVLNYESQIKQPAAFEDELVDTESSEQEQEMAATVMTSLLREDFQLSVYKDEYTEKLTRLIDSKVSGAELVTPPEFEAPATINLMDALKESVAQLQPPAKGQRQAKAAASSGKSTAAGKRKMAGSSRKKTPSTPRKKKSG